MHVCPLQARAVLCSCYFKEFSLTAATDSEAAAQPAGTWREDCAFSPSQPGHAALRSQATHHRLSTACTCRAAPIGATDSEQMLWVQAQQRPAAGQGAGGGGTPVPLSAWRRRLLHGKVRMCCSSRGYMRSSAGRFACSSRQLELTGSCYRAEVLTGHPFNNVTENIFGKIGANLHRRTDHPICTIKEAIYAFFDAQRPGAYAKFDDLHPVVSAVAVRPRALLVPSLPGCCSRRSATAVRSYGIHEGLQRLPRA